MYSTVNLTAPPGTAWAHPAWRGEWAMVLCPPIYGAAKEHKHKGHPECGEVDGGRHKRYSDSVLPERPQQQEWRPTTSEESELRRYPLHQASVPQEECYKAHHHHQQRKQRLFPGQLGSLSISKTQTHAWKSIHTPRNFPHFVQETPTNFVIL